MNYLVDTHIFLWSLVDQDKLSSEIKSIIVDEGNDIYVSQVTFWEISLKSGLGKLIIRGMSPEDIETVLENSFYKVHNFLNRELLTFHKLPKTDHSDPFDRMIVWQSIMNDFTLISADKKLKLYTKFGLKIVN